MSNARNDRPSTTHRQAGMAGAQTRRDRRAGAPDRRCAPSFLESRRQAVLPPELLADIDTGHNIVATVFMECAAMYRRDATPAMRPVGEVEFVNGIAAMSASGQFGSTRVAAGIVGYADLGLGSAVREVLEAEVAAGGGRFRGVRNISAWHPVPAARGSSVMAAPDLLTRPAFGAGLARPRVSRPFVRCLDVSHPARRADLACACASGCDHRSQSRRRGDRDRSVRRAPRRGVRRLAAFDRRARAVSQRSGQARRAGHASVRLRRAFARACRRRLGILAHAWRPYIETCIEQFGPPARCSRVIPRSTKAAAATRRCGTRSNALQQALRPLRRTLSSPARPRVLID